MQTFHEYLSESFKDRLIGAWKGFTNPPVSPSEPVKKEPIKEPIKPNKVPNKAPQQRIDVSEAKKLAGAGGSDLEFLLTLPFKTEMVGGKETWVTFQFREKEVDPILRFLAFKEKWGNDPHFTWRWVNLLYRNGIVHKVTGHDWDLVEKWALKNYNKL